MPQEINETALKNMSNVELPQAVPPSIDEKTGEEIPGTLRAGTLPHRQIPFQEYPRVVYKHPKKAYSRKMVIVDGHGNKEWQYVANQASSMVVKNKDEFDAAIKNGYKAKHYVVPPMPQDEPEEEPVTA